MLFSIGQEENRIQEKNKRINFADRRNWKTNR